MIHRLAFLLGGFLAATSVASAAPGRAGDTRGDEYRPELWAIIIGIDAHTDARILDGKTAVDSAFRVHDWFLKQAGWQKNHLLLLVDLGADHPGTVEAPAFPIQPLRKNLEWAFDVWLKDKAHPGDLIVVYYAGRSQGHVVTRGKAEANRNEYRLLPRDALLSDVEQTGFSLAKAIDPYSRQGKYQVVCWLGTGLERFPEATMPPIRIADQKKSADSTSPAASKIGRSKAPPSGLDWIRGLARWPGVSAWLASDVAQGSAAPSDPWVPFTSALLDGLGDADGKNNLAACLRAMQQTPTLKLQGFKSVGGVPPTLSLWHDQFVESLRPSRPEMVLQFGHAGPITGLATSADSQHMFTSSEDSTLRVWSLHDRALLRVLTGHEVGANALALTRDGKWLLSGGGRSGVMVHAVTDDYQLKLINRQPHGRRVEQVVPLPDGRHFLSLDQQAKCFLWDLNEPALTPRPWLDKVDCLEVAVGGGAGKKEPGIVAARCGDGSIRIFGKDGAAKEVIENPQAVSSALAVSPDGRSLAFGFDDGRVVLRDIARKSTAEAQGARGRITRLGISRQGKLAVGSERGVDLYSVTLGNPPKIGEGISLAPWPAASLGFSSDGLYLAACARDTGQLRIWRCDGDQAPREVVSQEDAGALSVAFTADGRSLAVGGKDGTVKTLPIDPKEGETPWERKSSRGKVQHLSASPSRRFLLILNDRNQLQEWDLKDRTCRSLPGRWSSGAYLSDRRLALTVAADAAEMPGKIVLMDSENSAINATFFARTAEGFEIDDGVTFGRVTVSPDGKSVAASANPEQAPLVCVWDTSSGKLTHWAPGIEDPVQTLDFSSDGRYLLTAGDSPQASLWDLSQKAGSLSAPARTFHDRSTEPVTRAIFRPGSSRTVITGYRDGRVSVWTWKDGAEQTRLRGFVASPGRTVKALAFSPDGRYLTVAGDAADLWVGEIDPTPRRITKLDGLMPHHFEQINALLAWPAPPHFLTLKFPSLDGSAGVSFLARPAPLLVSGSDDTTIKFWDLAAWNLRATFSAASADPHLAAVGQAPVELDWVVYTPEGRFDASGKGRELVRFRRKEQARLLDQFDDSLYAFQLGEQLRQGRSFGDPPSLDEPPPLAIDRPRRSDDSSPEAEIVVSLGSEDLRDLRIYQNDVPISTGVEEGAARPVGSLRIPVHLVRGSNRFYAMASRPNAFDSRSPEIEISYNGPREPGRVHILALGVGEYSRRRLSYPERDARRLSEVLQRRGIDAERRPGLKIVLTNDEVNQANVSRAFRDLAKQVRKRPQDTIVVFLAGHTGVFDQQKFCLLLKSYPFPATAPIMVASRDATDLIPADQLRAEYILPYASIAANMMRLDALNRLVIVDACQAEAIYSDPEVTDIQKWMEIGSRKARTSYLMAARKGEPALEIDPLKHGLFTYTLLRGMKALPAKEPKEISRLQIPVDADFDHDGTLTTGELDAYVKQTMPAISSQFPIIVANRRAAGVTGPGSVMVPTNQLGQESRVQTVTTSFPLVPADEVSTPASSTASPE